VSPTPWIAAVEGVEVVYHVGAAMKGWREDFEAGTIWGTRNIIDACLKHGVKRLVYVSSLGVLDVAGHVDGVLVNEASPVEPNPDLRGPLHADQTRKRSVWCWRRSRIAGWRLSSSGPVQIFGPGAEKVTPNGVIKTGGPVDRGGERESVCCRWSISRMWSTVCWPPRPRPRLLAK